MRRDLFKKYMALALICLASLTANAYTSAIADELNYMIELPDTQSPFSFSKYCKSVSGDLWAVDGGGQIRRMSKNEGSKLQRITDSALSAVYFVDSKTGWVVGVDGAIFFTADAGENWTKQKNESKDDLNAISCVSASLCWTVGNHGMVLRTRDGGASWEKINASTEAYLYAVDFIDEQRGWAVGSDGVIIRTQDGGEHWLSGLVTTRPAFRIPEPSLPSMRAVKFFDKQKGWVGGTEGLYQTEDGGITWKRRIKDVSFIGFAVNSPNKIWAVGSRGVNYVTRDLGGVWRKYIGASKGAKISQKSEEGEHKLHNICYQTQAISYGFSTLTFMTGSISYFRLIFSKACRQSVLSPCNRFTPQVF